MTIWQIIRRLVPFVKPYMRWVIFSLALTLLSAFAAQVNPIVLRYTVDPIERLLREGRNAHEGASLLIMISVILFSKEILNATPDLLSAKRLAKVQSTDSSVDTPRLVINRHIDLE